MQSCSDSPYGSHHVIACISGDGWEQDARGNYVEPAPSKYLKVTLRVSDDGYFISAMQNTDAPETASTTAPKTTAPETTLPEETQAETSSEAPSETESESATEG